MWLFPWLCERRSRLIIHVAVALQLAHIEYNLWLVLAH